jgi:hypothetical protein
MSQAKSVRPRRLSGGLGHAGATHGRQHLAELHAAPVFVAIVASRF